MVWSILIEINGDPPPLSDDGDYSYLAVIPAYSVSRENQLPDYIRRPLWILAVKTSRTPAVQ